MRAPRGGFEAPVVGLGRLADALASAGARAWRAWNHMRRGSRPGVTQRRRGPQQVGEGEQRAEQEGSGASPMLAEVEVAVAVELDGAALGARRGRSPSGRGGPRGRRGRRAMRPAGVGEAAAEVGLVRVDEEGGVEEADLLGGGPADQHRARLHPIHLAGALASALHRQPPVREDSSRQAPSPGPESARRRDGLALRRSAAAPRRRPPPAPTPPRPAARRRRRPGAPSPRSGAGRTRRAPPAAGGSRLPPCPRGGRARSGGSRGPARAPHRPSRRPRRCPAPAPRARFPRARCARSPPGRREVRPGHRC